jgi:hypothetical protein
MSRSRFDDKRFNIIGNELGLDPSDVRRAVNSFFSVILKDAKSLPFDNRTRIYTRSRFDKFGAVRNVPYLGRLGPVYSRYISWRRNESKLLDQNLRSSYRSRYLQSEIESTAEAILSGNSPVLPRKHKGNEIYDRVWVIGEDGRRLAKQVINKEDKYVSD